MSARTMALDALKKCLDEFSPEHDGTDFESECTECWAAKQAREAIAALEADIAHAGEPVACAWAVRRNDGGLQLFFVEESARRESECGMWRNPVIPLFTTPPEPAVNAELLEALQLLHDDIDEYQRINNLGGHDNHCMKLARAAIAKATS